MKNYTIEKIGQYFPAKFIWWEEAYTSHGDEMQHLFFAEKLKSEELYGNILVMWRGPLDIKFEFCSDTTERVHRGEEKFRIQGPDMLKFIADFPQIGNNLMLMYSLQNILVEMIARYVMENCQNKFRKLEVSESDIIIDGKKLNTGTCICCPTSSQLAASINLTFKGNPPVPKGVNAVCLTELMIKDEKEIIEDVRNLAKAWLFRVDEIQEKVYKTKILFI
jgi:hypothetical protein